MIGTISAMAVSNCCKPSATASDASLQDWQSEYERTLIASNDHELFGVPQSWSSVRRGLHPFSPERTLILQRQTYFGDREIQLAQKIGRRSDKAPRSKYASTILSIVHAATALTQTYGVPERTEDWAGRLTVWLFDYYSNVAQDHHWLAPFSWQGYGQEVKTFNGIVDWWLMLIPQGVESPSEDGTRLHTLITPVFTESWKPRSPVEFWCFMAKATGLVAKSFNDPQSIDSTWIDISRMDRQAACLFLNQRIARNLSTMT